MNFWLATVCIVCAYWYGGLVSRRKNESLRRKLDDLEAKTFVLKRTFAEITTQAEWHELKALADFTLERPLIKTDGREEKGA